MAQWLFERLCFRIFVALLSRWWAGLLGGAVCLGLTYLAYEHVVKEWGAARWGHMVRAVMIGVIPGVMSFCCLRWGLMNLFFGSTWRSKNDGQEGREP
jgi:hypothetical protein